MARAAIAYRIFAAILLSVAAKPTATAGGKAGIYGIRMVPYGIDAEQYSSPGWGVGVHAVVPVPEVANIIAGTAGFEWINLLDHTEAFIDDRTQLRMEQQTDQNYYRFYLGVQVGGHGNAFLRPHAGINIAILYYEIGTDIVIPDDYDREQEIRQKLRGEGNLAFGYDLSMGLDLNFSNTIALDGGVKYLKSFSVPQQLGEGSVRIHPQYAQIYLGIGVSLDMLHKGDDGNED
jgi:hypothetical protein